jgi:hypothetical protein
VYENVHWFEGTTYPESDALPNPPDHILKVKKGTVLAGSVPTPAPTDPNESNWKFEYWTAKSDGTGQIDWTKPINDDMKAYTEWTAPFVTVTYYPGADVPAGVVMPTSPTSIPEGPCWPGYSSQNPNPVPSPTNIPTDWQFNGWKTDAQRTTAFDPSKPITGPVSLYATWGETPGPDLTYVVFEDSVNHPTPDTIPDPVSVKSGKPWPSNLPTPVGTTTVPRWTFSHWTVMSEGGKIWNPADNIPVDGLVLYAAWLNEPVYPVTIKFEDYTADGKVGQAYPDNKKGCPPEIRVMPGESVTLPDQPSISDWFGYGYWVDDSQNNRK